LIKIDKPTLNDTEQIKAIIDEFAKKKDILPRSIENIAEKIREFVVIRDGSDIVAISSLRIYYPRLAEVRTIAVKENYQGRGFAKKLIEYEIQEAKELHIERVFALTFQLKFFEKMGFKMINKKQLPQKKIWEDCVKCPFFPDCKEEAVIREL
jgi:amino-acid N-acetyltransferase